MRRDIDEKNSYTENLAGVFGVFGSSDNVINYMQLNLAVAEIDKIGLVSEIPGSERWPIRQLFQRDIDKERVKNEIIPYFLNDSMAKFFNPLTIAVLPISNNGTLDKNVKEEVAQPDAKFSHAFEIHDHYKLSYDDNHFDAKLLWNPNKVRLVAIDGQHRLHALKRLFALHKQNPGSEDLRNVDFINWRIPIVLVTIGHASEGETTDGILEKTRNIFVTINKQAKQPTRSRTILLNDYSVSAICTQELLDKCRDNGVPLAIFNWRDHKDEEYPEYTTHLIAVDELEDLLIHFFISEDDDSDKTFALSVDQKSALFWDDQGPLLGDGSIASLRESVRSRFGETVLPSFFYILSSIKPYSEYISFLKNLENELTTDSEIHAWSRVVYGSDYSDELIEREVSKSKKVLLGKCNTDKSKLGDVFSKAVGLRSIFSAFKSFIEVIWADEEIIPWADGAKLFVSSFNRVYDAGFLESNSFLNNLVKDSGNNIINYKLSQVRVAYGAVISYACLFVHYNGAQTENVSFLRDKVYRALLRSYKKDFRPQVKEELGGRPSEEINDEINNRASSAARAQLREIDSLIEGLIAAD
ncbi:DNA sulfur modification protein DndB [Marinobacter sp. ELB17]|uniref:DNA sulfur modification protein DndB n=1 Tax=Marinobacter sp. ELB17 TaxID=270374 RepID=UPI0000F38FB9|nr:DNA sulfur modification protein DndB [Marinobacter sp. ELB17]EBA00892.1 hypothetical protein MELB17_17604 [Marinobacter sp. ELB17]